MPRLEDTRNQSDVRILSTIAKYLVVRNMSKKDLIRLTGIKQSSFYHYMKNPSQINVGDLRLVYDKLRVPQDERYGL